ncbi:MAG: hypothetical protein ACRERE_41730 [Candidatus Entotheonellia bacterium]
MKRCEGEDMTQWSLVAGVLGVVGTGAVVAYVNKRTIRSKPAEAWFLGLAGLSTAWLLAFVSLLAPATASRPDVSLSVSWILSSAAALLGVMLTDGLMRRLQESRRARHPMMYWLLGVSALCPAWGIALLGLIRTTS